jgi:hypothetical protein
MPSLDLDFLRSLKDDFSKFKCFIETGTYNGDTIFAVEPLFDKLYTIEFSDLYYNRTKAKYNGDKINFIYGDSSIVFETLLPQLNEPCIFFLDGHWSGEATGKATKDVPLNEEITHINNLFLHEAILIVDDFRLFGLDPSSGKLLEDWSNINKDALLTILESRISQVYHLDSVSDKDDRLIIHINAKK